jgi:hypothetical protein
MYKSSLPCILVSSTETFVFTQNVWGRGAGSPGALGSTLWEGGGGSLPPQISVSVYVR